MTPKEFPDKFNWTPKQAKQREPWTPIVEPQAPGYGPHICTGCYGVGLRIDRDGDGSLKPCTECSDEVREARGQASNELLEECWRLSGMNPAQANPPSLDALPTRNDPAAEKMRRAAAAFVEGKYQWLTMYGPPGGLKSTVGQAIARAFLASHRAALYMRAPDLFFYLGAVQRGPQDPDYEARLFQLSRMKVLIIDEFGKEGDSDFIQRVRTSLLDTRYQRAMNGFGAQTVLLSNFAPEEWSDRALASRARDSQFICIPSSSVDYRRIKRS